MATPNPTAAEPLPELPGLMLPNWNGGASGVKLTPKTHTTRRGLATASLCLGLWSGVTFPVYPFGLMIGLAAMALGTLAVLLGVRAGNEGQHLAWVGIVLGSVGVGTSILIYRFYQLAFEGSLPPFLSFSL